MEKAFDAVLALAGFLLAMAAVGGLDNASDADIYQLVILGICGLVVMFLGIEYLKED